MTTPNRQSPQVKSKTKVEGTKQPWYRSPVVWLGIIITVVVLIGCLQFLYLAAEIRSNESSRNIEIRQDKATNKKELTHILGVPISASSIAEPEKPNSQATEGNIEESSTNNAGENADDSL